MKTANEIPRRNRLDQNTYTELAIFNAIQAVEKAGVHPLLTDVVLMLSQAKDKLSDFVDGVKVQPKKRHDLEFYASDIVERFKEMGHDFLNDLLSADQMNVIHEMLIQFAEENTNQPPTAQQATSKSLSDILNEIGKREGCENWHHLYGNLSGGDHDEYIKEAGIIFASQFQHPQDSSSGEVVKCKGNCGMNYCDENGCVESKQHLSEPIPPASESPCEKCKGEDGNGLEGFTCTKCGRAFKNNHEVSESLEQAAKSFLMDRINKHCVVSTGGRLIMLSNPLTADIIVEWIVEFATQQQKPLAVVLPGSEEIRSLSKRFIAYERQVAMFGKDQADGMDQLTVKVLHDMVDEIRTRLSAANGVDPIELLKWSLRLTTEERFIHKPHDPRYNDDILRIYNKYLEQSQQQNKGK